MFPRDCPPDDLQVEQLPDLEPKKLHLRKRNQDNQLACSSASHYSVTVYALRNITRLTSDTISESAESAQLSLVDACKIYTLREINGRNDKFRRQQSVPRS